MTQYKSNKAGMDWAEIQLFTDAVKGLEAMEKLVGESPSVLLNKPAQAKWEAAGKMTEAFYKLDIQERLYVTGYATRPTHPSKSNSGEVK